MSFLSKFKFFWQKPKVVIVINRNQKTAKKIISQILGVSFNIDKEILFVDRIEKVNLSKTKYLILGFDDNDIKKFKEETSIKNLTFGFQPGADIQISNLKQNGHNYLNFKINYKGSIVPIWLKECFNKEQIYAVLAAISIGVVFGLNLVEISQALKSKK